MEKEYQKHIVSTPKHQVWLHRTHTSNIEGILKRGLYFGAGDLSSTATLQPSEIERAESYYQMTHKGNNALVVLKIPQILARRHYLEYKGLKGPRHNGYEGDKEITYFDGGFYIQRQHIHGWIDKETNEYYENPYRTTPQKLTDQHFPAQTYGGLEKDLIKEKPKPEKEKTPKIKRRVLSPPPKEIHI